MTFCYSLIDFNADFVSFNVGLKTFDNKPVEAFKVLQTWLNNNTIYKYEVVDIRTQHLEVRVQINIKQIVWNNGTEICFKSLEES